MSILTELASLPAVLQDIVEAIYALRSGLSAQPCGCPVGEGVDNPGGDETTIPGQEIGSIEFIELVPIDERKCKAADYIYDAVKQTLVYFNANNIVEITGGVIASVLTLMAAFLALTGPFGAIILAVAGLALAVAILIVTETLDTADMESTWIALQDDIICCLYEAANTSGARVCVENLLNASSLSSGEVDFIMLFMPEGVLSLLFADTDESVAFFDGYVLVYGCDVCDQPAGVDWFILPELNILAYYETDSGYLGTGTVLQDGTQFTITSSQIIVGPDSGRHIIGLSTFVFWERMQSQGSALPNPAGSYGGQYSRHSTLPGTLINAIGRRVTTIGCTTGPQDPSGAAPPVTEDHFQAFRWLATAQFQITFSIVSPPALCP